MADSVQREWRPETAWQGVREGTCDAASVYAAQRARCPVSRSPSPQGFDVWHVFDAADVASVLADTETYSSAVPKFGERLIPIEVDPPEHTEYRKLLSRMMSPRRMVSYEEAVRANVGAALEPLIAAGSGDIAELTYKLPIKTFCLLMGEDDLAFDELDRARRAGSPPADQVDADAATRRQQLMEPLRQFCRERLIARRAEPRDDLASDIANATLNGAPLAENEALSILSLIYIAGHQSTTGGMQSALLRIASDPAVQARLRADRALIPAAIEEALRLETPLHTLPRYCTRDAELGGRQIKAGDQVYPVYGAANLDPAAFPAPEQFDIDRKPVHFAFGRGPHMCAGAPLARMQIRVLIEELLARTQTLSIVGTPQRKPWPQNACEALVLAFG